MDELAEITQHLLRSSPDALVVVDSQGRIRFANDTVTELFGYHPQELMDQPLDVLVPERLRTRHHHHLGGYFSQPRSREMGAAIADLFARRADGSEFAAGIRLAPFRIGEKLYVAAAIRDSTERRQVNEALVAAREDADRANRAKSRFLATASHDLRQPLQTIKMLNASMVRLAKEPDMATLLQHQAQAIEGMTRLLNALLDISRLESGAIEPKLVTVPLPDVFAELRNEFESMARDRGLKLDVQFVPWIVQTDRILFTQLLQNLLGNAIKYTDQGSIALIGDSDAQGLTLKIIDTGIGIPADKLERIFDEYYQVDTHGAKRLGVGLGLAIVKEVARLLGYRIGIRSQLGDGTDVAVSIPRTLTSVLPLSQSVAQESMAAPAPARRGRVLLVEDNEGVRIATELFLKLEGFETLTAGSAMDAEVQMHKLQSKDVLIADYHLDGSHTGLDVLTRVRALRQEEVPGIILSGDLPSVLRTLKDPIPNARFLSKPVDTQALLNAIDELSGAAVG
jgi:PAS domain S-box-containing protein